MNIRWKDWCWSSSTLATWYKELTHWKRPWCWKILKVEGEGDNRGWDGWMASPTQWSWVWVDSRSCWRTWTWTTAWHAAVHGVTKSRTWLSDWTELTINIFLPIRNKFAYSCGIKICTPGFNKLLESIFCLLLVVEEFSLQKIVKMLDKIVVSWQEVRWIWQMRQNFIAQFVQLLKHWLFNIWPGIVVEKYWAHSVHQCQPQPLQILVHLIDLLSILLKCKPGFRKL